MIAVPLEVPLRTLAPNRLVWIQRGGLVYPYPARIVRDIANDLYVSDEFDPTPTECAVGAVMMDHAARRTNVSSLQVLARSAWSKSHGNDSAGFDVWWDSVDQAAPPWLLGAAASYAARNVLTWSLFKHRYMIDTAAASL